MSSEKPVSINPLTLRSLIIGVALSAILTYVLGYGYLIAHNSPLGLTNSFKWPNGGTLDAVGVPAAYSAVWGLLIAIVAFMMIVPKKYRLNPAEIAFVLTCIVTVPILTGDAGLGSRWMSTMAHQLRQGARVDYVLQNTSPLLWPNDLDVLQGMRYGTLSPSDIPWAAWTTPLIFQFALFIILRLFLVFGTSILQELWVDVEALPFPLQTVNYELIHLTRSEASEKLGIWRFRRTKVLFLIGFVIALVWYLLLSPVIYYPSLQLLPIPIHQYSPRPGTNPLQFDFTPTVQMGMPLHFDFEIGRYGWLLIMPIDVTMTFTITQLIFYFIIPPILVGAGQVRDWGTGRRGLWVMTREIFHNQNTPTTAFRDGYAPLFIGVMAGLAIVPIILQRRNTIASLKAAISGGYSGSFLSPRILWAGWAVTGLGVVALFTAAGVPIYYSFVLLTGICIWYLAMARTTALSGLWPAVTGPGNSIQPQYSGVNAHAYSMRLFGLAPNLSAEAYNTAFIGAVFFDPANAGLMPANPIVWNMGMFKLAQLTSADRKKMTVAMIVNSVLPILIVMPLGVYLLYTQGGWQIRSVGNTSRTMNEAWSITHQGTALVGNIDAPYEFTWVLIAVGFAIVLFLAFARTRLGGPILYISPFGIALGLLGDAIIFFGSAIIVSIVRLIVARIGGPRMYEEKVLPIAIGLLAFTGVQWILNTVCLVLRGMGYVWWAV